MEYPAQLQYNNINPKGFFSTFKQWTIQPLASGGIFWPGQIVKILIQSVVSGVMDPYRSHIQFQVQVDQQILPVGGLQVDSSAQSFIQQLVISSKNKQIERIPQYSVLAAWLTDIGLSQMYAQGRQTQGLGFSNIQSVAFGNKVGLASNIANVPQTSATGVGINTGNYIGDDILVHGNTNIFPTQSSTFYQNQFQYRGATIPKDIISLQSKNIKGHIPQILNPAILPNQTQQTVIQSFGYPVLATKNISNYSIQRSGYLKNLRAQYLDFNQNSTFTDSTTSKPSSQIQLDRTVFNGDPNAQWQNGTKYKTLVPTSIKTRFNQVQGVTATVKQIPNTTSINGFTSLYSPNFCKGVRQPMISATIPQCQMKNGMILKQKIPITKRIFKVPIISAILGLLIPQDQFVLLPIKALNQVLLQFTIDKYAMFTTGYNDISQLDQQGMSLMQQRAFMIKRVFYKMHTYQFYDPQIDQYLSKSLMDRILLNCNMWTLGNQYQIVKGQNINNNWPVACTSQALNEIVVLFVPLDYQHYSFCRKHFRISNNVTKFQLRVNMQYYPSQPILGNGGNPCFVQGADNSAFIQQIFWSNNFMFNKVNPWPRINAYNFAINQRCYNIQNKNTMYTNTNNSTTTWDANTVNYDTALGMPFVHQNRFVGKAGYVYGFQPYAHSAYHLTGMDCRQVRQFDVLLNTHPYDNFPRQQTMYIFTRSSVIVQFGPNGINVYGR